MCYSSKSAKWALRERDTIRSVRTLISEEEEKNLVVKRRLWIGFCASIRMRSDINPTWPSGRNLDLWRLGAAGSWGACTGFGTSYHEVSCRATATTYKARRVCRIERCKRWAWRIGLVTGSTGAVQRLDLHK